MRVSCRRRPCPRVGESYHMPAEDHNPGKVDAPLAPVGRASVPYAAAVIAARAAAANLSISASPCTVETNPASKGDGAR